MGKLTSRNPYTNEILETFESATDAAIESALVKAEVAAARARSSPLKTRQDRLRALGGALKKHREELARIATLEMGKTITAARAEVDKCALTANWFADRLPELLDDIEIQKQPYR